MTGDRARVVIFSYSDVVGEIVALLRELGSEPVALVVPSNRSVAATSTARAAGAGAGLAVIEQPPRVEIAPFLRLLGQKQADLILIWSYSMILPAEVIDLPSRGCVNVHGGLLPEYRGGHVLQWALINGEAETGVTLHYVDEGIDTGPVIARRAFPIGDDDDAASVARKLCDTGFATLREHWPAIVDGTAASVPQSGASSYWPLRGPEDNEIRWDEPAARVRDLVRSLVAPWPGAFTRAGDSVLVIDRVAVAAGPVQAPPGTVTEIGPRGIVVAAADAPVAILAARLDGTPVGPGEAGFSVGDVLGSQIR